MGLVKLSLVFGMLVASQAHAKIELLQSFSIPMSHYGMSWENVYLRFFAELPGDDRQLFVEFQEPLSERVSKVAAVLVDTRDDGLGEWEVFANLEQGDHRLRVISTDLLGEDENEYGPLENEWLASDTGPKIYEDIAIMHSFRPKILAEKAQKLTVTLRNLAYEKRVTLHYSFDGWQTQNSAQLSFEPSFSYGYGRILSPTSEGFELWSTSLEIPDYATELDYYFSYETAGKYFIDNNFSKNYVLER